MERGREGKIKDAAYDKEEKERIKRKREKNRRAEHNPERRTKGRCGRG